MWKRLKLLTLIALTAILAIVTYPTWHQLVSPDEESPPEWSADDSIYLVASRGLDYRLVVSLDSGYIQDAGFDSPTRGDIAVRVEPDSSDTSEAQLLNTPKAGIFYINSTGNLARWLDDCQIVHRVLTLSPSTARLAPTTLLQVPQEVKSRLTSGLKNNGIGIPMSIHSIRDLGPADELTCDIPNSALWAEYNGLINFAAPSLSADTVNSTEANNPPATHATGHSPCVSISAGYPGQFAISYKSSDGYIDPDESKRSPAGIVWNGSSWNDCPSRSDTRDWRIVAKARLGLLDLSQKEVSDRNIFFAGVFAGVFGALAIEVFNGIFEVAEGWRDRRRTRRDEEEQRPEPTPEPPPPPDDEVDRDQLPLF